MVCSRAAASGWQGTGSAAACTMCYTDHEAGQHVVPCTQRTTPHASPATCKMRTLLLLVLRLAAALVAAVIGAAAIGTPREQPVAALVHGAVLCSCNN